MKVTIELDTSLPGDASAMDKIAAALADTVPVKTTTVAPAATQVTSAAAVVMSSPETAQPEPETADETDAQFRVYGKPLSTTRRTKDEMAEDKEIEDLFESLAGRNGIPSEIPTDVPASDFLKLLKNTEVADEASEQSGASDDDDDGEDEASEQSGASDDDDGEDEELQISTTDELRGLVLKANKKLSNETVVDILKKYGKGLSKIAVSDIPTVAKELRDAMADA